MAYGGPRPGMPPAGFGYPAPVPPMGGMYGGHGGPRPGGFGGPPQMGPYGVMPPQMGGMYGGRGGMGGPMGGPMGGMGGGMGFRGGMHPPRRRKQFVGGTLESQREWEQQNICCFYLQGLCKFGDRCRYSHEVDDSKGCQFGLSCRVGHASRGAKTDAPAPAPQQQQQAPAPQ